MAQREREAGGEVNVRYSSRGERGWVHKELSGVLEVKRDERTEMED